MPFPRAALVILGLAAAPAASCGGDADPCQAAFGGEQWTAAASTCRVAFERTGAAGDGIRAALASDYLDDIATSTALARRLTAGPEAARAHRLLAESDRRAGHHAAAATRGATALALHAAAGADREVARDAYALAGVIASDGLYEDALPLIALARDAAVRCRDRRMQGHSEIGRGDMLRVLGDRIGAERAYEVAAGLLAPYCDRGEVRYKQARLHAAQGQITLARQALDEVLAGDAACHRPDVLQGIAINRAWLSWRRGELDAAEAEVAGLDDDVVDAAVIRALVRAARGDPAVAIAALAGAANSASGGSQWPWLLPHLEAQLEELRGDDAAAEAGYRRAIAAVARMRAAAPMHAGYLAASHRLPHEGLIGLYARHQRWRDALGVVLALDASGLLRAAAEPGVLGEGGVVEPAAGGERPVAITQVPSEDSLDVDSAVAAWAGRDLVVLVVPVRRFVPGVADRAWRIRVHDGAVTGADAGPADALDLAAERLLGDPGDRAAAAALGAALVPAGTAPLHVLPIGRVAQAPLAAVRIGDRLALADRPLLRVLGLRPRPAAPGRRSGAVVLGDPRGDLAAAASEARAVAAALHATAELGPAATVARLLAARGADVLHVAAHTDERAGRRVLHLADGDVVPRVILDQRIAPRLVVLASCGSAAARDEGGWGSLAAAFATAGSDHVLATQWSVDDTVAADLIHRFYAAGGVADPARALAAVQVALAAPSASTAWSAFTLIAAPPALRPRDPPARRRVDVGPAGPARSPR
jgi:tetratricopeptide (TPR) repeat protein